MEKTVHIHCKSAVSFCRVDNNRDIMPSVTGRRTYDKLLAHTWKHCLRLQSEKNGVYMETKISQQK